MPDPDSDPPTLRERQSERVHEEIRAAFVRCAVERGVDEFSMQDVAEAAGVSHRTLYRYYSSRNALIEDVLADAERKIEAAKTASLRPDGVGLGHPDAVAGAFVAFERHADLVRTSARLRDADVRDARHDERTLAVRRYLKESGVDLAALDALTALVRMLTGSEGWITMTSPEFGLDAREAGLAAHWAAQVLIRAAAEQPGPLEPTPSDTGPTADHGGVDDGATDR